MNKEEMSPFNFTVLTQPDIPEELARVDELWKQACMENKLPSRNDIDLLKIPSSRLRFTSISDYDPGQDTFAYSFFGSGFVEVDGKEMTGKSHMDLPQPELGMVIDRVCRKVVSEKRECIASFSSESFLDGKVFAIAGRWPLSDDGKNVSAILTVAEPKDSVNRLKLAISQNAPAHR